MSYYNDVDGVMKFLGCDCEGEEWCLFTDASNASLKGVLMEDVNFLQSVFSCCSDKGIV